MAIKNELTVKTTDGNMRVCVMDITPKKAQGFYASTQTIVFCEEAGLTFIPVK